MKTFNVTNLLEAVEVLHSEGYTHEAEAAEWELDMLVKTAFAPSRLHNVMHSDFMEDLMLAFFLVAFVFVILYGSTHQF